MSLTGKQRRHLRALGHGLTPVVHIGKDGLTEAVARAVAQALADHELIKVKLGPNTELERDAAAEQLADMTESEVAQILGKTILLYRARDDNPTIVLPKPTEPDDAAPN
jgi:RNA-binding protein